jgi:antitoxin (DNA-binding transcriptional repressor) of toxin-antitoxin stability system
MSQVEIEVAERDLRSLIERARAGEEVVLVEEGRELAKLVTSANPVEEDLSLRRCGSAGDGWQAPADLFEPTGKPLRLGLLTGKASVPRHFDAALPDDLLDLFEGR